DALMKLRAIYKDALTTLLAEYRDGGIHFVDKGYAHSYQFVGGECSKTAICSYSADLTWIVPDEPRIRPAPKWMGGQNVYAFIRADSGTPLYSGISKKRDDVNITTNDFNEFDFFRQLSERLPGWVYLYFAPGKL